MRMNVDGCHASCRELFESVYIDRNGDVSACSHRAGHQKPFGNIRERHLTEILRDSAELALLQADSRAGRLKCFWRCNLLPYFAKHGEPDGVDGEPTLPMRIRKLKLSIGWLCNANCVMCPQDHRERSILDGETLSTRVDWSAVDQIMIEGGEPLAIKETFRLWDHLTALGKRVNFLSNGLLITPEIAERIVATSDFLYLSVNAATAETYYNVMRVDRWARLLSAIRMVREVRDARKANLALIAHFTINSENLHETAAFIDWADSEGFDIANYSYNKVGDYGPPVPWLLKEDPARGVRLRGELRAAIAASRARGRLRVDPSRLLYLGLLKPGEDVVDRAPVLPSGN